MEFYEGFIWAVPKAFKDAIASCSFEEGDTLYCTRDAYSGTWGGVVDKIEHAIKVRFPSRSSNKKTTADISSVFKSNWNAAVTIEFVIGRDMDIDEKIMHTTQGRLFTLLQTGNINILSEESKKPEIPLLIDSLKTHVSDSRITDTINHVIDGKYEKPNIVIIPYDESNDTLVAKTRAIISSIHEFKPDEIDFPLSGFDFLKKYYFHPTLAIKVIVIDSNSPEKIRDHIKEALWPKREPKNSTKSVYDIITREKSTSANPFKLSNHMVFRPFQIKKHGEIRVHSFNHSPAYRYRLHCSKIENQKDIPKALTNYLDLVFTDCPNHLFGNTSFRVSKIDFPININIKHTEQHALIHLAKESREFKKFKSRHENLGEYFLNNDRGSIAVELPLWIESGEFQNFGEIFKTNEALTGHIDLLRIEDSGKIAIWDYKPNAYKEIKAHVQVFLYAYMLSVRTGIKLSNFICGYFDEVDCYQFNPSEVIIDGCENT